ncbi:MAG: sigma-70 family RNA polymerase sigma factor [Planctomycetes bacterium]|nr:sigma-70 family RNA polymerase sigma factor [Planctomycetota bacterium]
MAEQGSNKDEDIQALVVRAKAGDTDALNELFARHQPLLLDVARRRIGARLKMKEEPDDLAQTTFREATRDFRNYEYRGPDSLVRWLMQILQNKIRDKAEFYSANKRDQTRERTLSGPAQPGGEPTPGMDLASPDLSVTMQVSREEAFGHLRQALGELSKEHREAITLVFFEGLSLREAGEKMEGRSEDAVRMMLRRAESKLGELLKGSLGRDLGPV